MLDFPHSALEEYKTQAAILLKRLRSEDAQLAVRVARRFQQLLPLGSMSEYEIIQSDQIKLKHALAVIAHEHNFNSWADFKHHLERRVKVEQRRNTYFTLHYPRQCFGFVLEWHTDYTIASQELEETGGYLFPYKNQYFICEAAYIEVLGLDPDDPDWECIGYNWVQPADDEAWQRLDHKLRTISEQK